MRKPTGSWGQVVALSAACLVWTAAGCPPQGGGNKMDPGNTQTNVTPPEVHGPHGGHVLEMDPLHVELHMDAERNLTAFILGADVKTPSPSENAKVVLNLTVGMEKKEIALTPSPLEGETAEKCSRFTAAASNFPESVKDIEEVTGELVVTLGMDTKTLKIEHDHAAHAH